MVQTNSGQPSQYGPQNVAPHGGQVRYLNAGASFVINARRESAYKKMFDECGGKYVITSEVAQDAGTAMMFQGNMGYAAPTNYAVINFECVR